MFQAIFRGYGIQRKDLSHVYRTSNSEYGWYTPCVHTVPHRFNIKHFSISFFKFPFLVDIFHALMNSPISWRNVECTEIIH